jgi:hypothetical protein
VFEEFANRFPTSGHGQEARARADKLKNSELAMLPPGSGAQIGKLLNAPANAPIASFTRHNGGWLVAFSFAEPVTGISWRLGEAGNFRETGFMDALDPRTRRRMPNPAIEMPISRPPPSTCATLMPTAAFRGHSRSASIPSRRLSASSAKSLR